MTAAAWSDPAVLWDDPIVSWDGHDLTPWAHTLQLGVDVATGRPGYLWSLGAVGMSELGVTTRLAATADLPGIWQPLDCDLVEVTWSQGTSDGPDRVVNRPDPGTLQVIAVDPDLQRIPTVDLEQGIRPGRGIRVVDRGTGQVLWYGWVETSMWDLHPGNPLHHHTITAVDAITRLSRVPVEAGRIPEPAWQRVTWLMDTYAPSYPYRVDSGATHQVAATRDSDLWGSLLDAMDSELGWLWVRRDGTVEADKATDTVNPPRRWNLTDPCLPVSVPEAMWDSMGWGTVWTCTRVDPGTGIDPVPQTVVNARAESVYGRWQANPLDSYPVVSDGDALRVASVAASWRGWPRLAVSTMRVDVTAAAHVPGGSVLLDLVRLLELGDEIDAAGAASLPLPSYPMLVIGWTWTWTAAGGLSGSIQTELPVQAALTGAYWILGATSASRLGSSTYLAPAGLP